MNGIQVSRSLIYIVMPWRVNNSAMFCFWRLLQFLAHPNKIPLVSEVEFEGKTLYRTSVYSQWSYLTDSVWVLFIFLDPSELLSKIFPFSCLSRQIWTSIGLYVNKQIQSLGRIMLWTFWSQLMQPVIFFLAVILLKILGLKQQMKNCIYIFSNKTWCV